MIAIIPRYPGESTAAYDDRRTRMLTVLRDRLGREPTAEDVTAEKERERAAKPMVTIAIPPAVKVTL